MKLAEMMQRGALRKSESRQSATATPATPATVTVQTAPSVATVATVAVAKPRERKVERSPLSSDQRPDVHGFDLPALKAEAGADWPLLEADSEALDAFAQALSIRRLRDQGERPAHYTSAATCDACGPVWLWPGAPARVAACPWCFNRATGKPVPPPPVPGNKDQ